MKNFNVIIAIVVIFQTSCEKSHSDYIQAYKTSILYVYTRSVNIEADGKSMTKLVASIATSSDLRSIYFHTTSGVFQDNHQDSIVILATPSNDSLQSITYLISSLEATDNVTLRISVPQIDTLLNVRFITAFPDSIHIESTVGSIKKEFNSEAPIQTWLIRNIGIPSLHQRVKFRGITESGDSIGTFRSISPLGSDSNGLITAVFQLKDTLYTGVIKLFADATGKFGLLSDTVKINVTK